MGRPTKYSEAIANKICNKIATGSKGLVQICKDKDLPSVSTIYSWLNKKNHPDFMDRYARARETQADLLADEIIQIADTPLLGKTTKKEKGKTLVTEEGDMLGHRKLQIDARKWKASKLAPKKYGDKLDVDLKVQKLGLDLEDEEYI